MDGAQPGKKMASTKCHSCLSGHFPNNYINPIYASLEVSFSTSGGENYNPFLQVTDNRQQQSQSNKVTEHGN